MESAAVQMGSAVDTILSEIETRIGVIELAVTDIPDQNRIQARIWIIFNPLRAI